MTPDAAHRSSARTGVLLVNLGTPAEPTAAAIRRYLRQFLSDRRVVEVPRLLWLAVLHLFILPLRPRRLVAAYRKVWTPAGSPLMVISQAQQAALSARFGGELVVGLAMTYGEPSIDHALVELERAGVRRALLLPLYPQYSGTTTAATCDALFDALRRRRWLPELRTIASYHDDTRYIEALAASAETHWREHGRGDHLLISFHSIPRRYVEAGDPYLCHCHKTARLLAARLGLAPGQFSIAFQSRLGRQPWLMPYTDVVVPQLAARGIRRLDVICPGFAADCLETLEEVALRYAAAFTAAGGSSMHYIPALNDAPAHIDALEALIRRHLQGWTLSTLDDAEALAQRAARVAAARPGLDSPGLR